MVENAYFCARIISQRNKNELSILIPNYNNVSVELVTCLQKQAEALGIDYEIIVADDCSTNQEVIRKNDAINGLPHCRYIVKEQNTGSAATRNYLSTISRYHWLLFLDCDITIPDTNYLKRYVSDIHNGVINGGISIIDDTRLKHNLRYLYEKVAESAHTPDKRQQQPYKEFRSTNFIIEREVFKKCPFDERFKLSGYEDVLFGKQLKEHSISITHIDNPVMMTDFEANPDYVSKIERSTRTLYTFRQELRGYSRLLDITSRLPHFPIRLWHKLFGRLERRNLTGSHPRLWIFKIYKLGYFLSLP